MSAQRTYIQGRGMISSLGINLSDHLAALSENRSGIKQHAYSFGALSVSAVDEALLNEAAFKWDIPTSFNKFESLAAISIREALLEARFTFDTTEMPLFIASTKGNIDEIGISQAQQSNYLLQSAKVLQNYFGLKSKPIIVCNACTSGLMAVIMASRMIQAGNVQNAIVCGVDVLSEFTLRGFSCLHAMSPQSCKPFDESRAGVTLGEACGTVILSSKKSKLNIEILGGASSNDANHISGPSRTGAGLQQAVRSAMKFSDHPSIDYINAHGTATMYNDEMEAQAFNALSLETIPLHSMKGYWGHTLGAAGVLELLGASLCMEKNLIVKSVGYETHGLTLPLNVVTKNKKTNIKHCLKTSSGFGGSNSALIIKYLGA